MLKIVTCEDIKGKQQYLKFSMLDLIHKILFECTCYGHVEDCNNTFDHCMVTGPYRRVQGIKSSKIFL